MRIRLLLLIAAALTPILLFAGFRSYLDAREARVERRNRLLDIAETSIDSIEQSLATAETLLLIYADDIASGQCSRVYDTLRDRVPSLSHVMAFNEDMVATCSSLGETGFRSTSARWHDQMRDGIRTVRTEAFYGRVSETWIFGLFRRVDDASGQFAGSAAFSMRADRLADLISQARLPDDVEIALSDETGQIFGSSRFLSLESDWIAAASQDRDGELFVNRAIEGGRFDIVVRPVAANKIFAVISRPSPGIINEFTLRPVDSIGLPLLSFSVTLLAAWLAIDALVLKWLARLRRLALIYGEGHYGFRTGSEFDRAPDEIAGFANAFDTMAARIAERDATLKEALATRDAAVKEIHHRVKNNLQIVASFLNLQRRQVEDEKARAALSAARHRIDALSIVHQTLYQHERLETVHLKPFLEALLTHLGGAMGVDELEVKLTSSVPDIERPADDAIPIALFVLEAVTNALKYAFDDDGGTVLVDIEEQPDMVVLEIRDDGRGLEIDENAKARGLGSKLMTAFARQLKANMTQHSKPGEGFTVRLEMPPFDEANSA